MRWYLFARPHWWVPSTCFPRRCLPDIRIDERPRWQFTTKVWIFIVGDEFGNGFHIFPLLLLLNHVGWRFGGLWRSGSSRWGCGWRRRRVTGTNPSVWRWEKSCGGLHKDINTCMYQPLIISCTSLQPGKTSGVLEWPLCCQENVAELPDGFQRAKWFCKEHLWRRPSLCHWLHNSEGFTEQ